MPQLSKQPLTFESVVRPTALIQSVRLNHKTGLDISLACETWQVTGSFKFRAAFNVASNVAQTHIITASSGNFGQALAYACRLLSKRCTVVMPDNSASVKIEAVREFGAEVELIDTLKKSRAQRVSELSQQFPEAYVASAYDDPLVIEGNASLGREFANLAFPFDAILTPVGGGGLSGGIIQGLCQGKSNSTKVYGVEPELANDCALSLKAGHIVANENEPQTVADGVRTLSIGAHNWQLIKQGMEEVIEVSEAQICDALRLLFMLANIKAEPTGAVALAGAIASGQKFQDKRICCVVSGGNVDKETFHRIICKS